MPKNEKNKSLILSLLVSLSTTLILFSILFISDKNSHFFLYKIILPLSKFILIVFLTLLFTSYIEAKGWISKTSFLFKPIMTFSNLSIWSISSFTTAFISGIMANTILFNAYKEQHIDKKELFITNMLNHSIPAYVLHTPSVMAILIPILGIAGLIYVSITLVSALARGILIIFFARFLLKNNSSSTQVPDDEFMKKNEKQKNILETIKKNTYIRFIKIFMWTLPIYTFTILIQELGFFRWLQHKSFYFFIDFMPIEGLSVIIFSIIMEFNAGVVAAGALLNSGVLNLHQTVLALIIGSVIATPIQSLRHQLPTYMGIYTPILGIQLILINQILRIVSLLLVGLPLFFYLYY